VGVVVRPKVFFLSFLLLLCKVRLSVDGQEPVLIAWGDNWIPMAPGRHTLRCWTAYLWYRHLGDATIEIDVPPAGYLRAQWRTPWLIFLAGTWKVVPG
jgi:hypothetical protein